MTFKAESIGLKVIGDKARLAYGRRVNISGLIEYAEATDGLLSWAKDHGADAEFIKSLRKLRRNALREARVA